MAKRQIVHATRWVPAERVDPAPCGLQNRPDLLRKTLRRTERHFHFGPRLRSCGGIKNSSSMYRPQKERLAATVKASPTSPAPKFSRTRLAKKKHLERASTPVSAASYCLPESYKSMVNWARSMHFSLMIFFVSIACASWSALILFLTASSLATAVSPKPLPIGNNSRAQDTAFS